MLQSICFRHPADLSLSVRRLDFPELFKHLGMSSCLDRSSARSYSGQTLFIYGVTGRVVIKAYRDHKCSEYQVTVLMLTGSRSRIVTSERQLIAQSFPAYVNS
jgi:hypothetical protein